MEIIINTKKGLNPQNNAFRVFLGLRSKPYWLIKYQESEAQQDQCHFYVRTYYLPCPELADVDIG